MAVHVRRPSVSLDTVERPRAHAAQRSGAIIHNAPSPPVSRPPTTDQYFSHMPDLTNLNFDSTRPVDPVSQSDGDCICAIASE